MIQVKCLVNESPALPPLQLDCQQQLCDQESSHYHDAAPALELSSQYHFGGALEEIVAPRT